MATATDATGDAYTVRSNERDDPGHVLLRSARDKIAAHAARGLTLARQWPDAAAPTRILVVGDGRLLLDLLREFAPAVQIEPNQQNVRLEMQAAVLAEKWSDTMPDQPSLSDNGAEDGGSGNPHHYPDDASIEVLASKPDEFIFSPKRTAGRAAVQMLNNPGSLINDLKTYSGLDIEIVRTRSRAGVGAAAAGAETSALLVKMEAAKGEQFAQQSLSAASPFWVERNQPVRLFEGVPSPYFTAPEPLAPADGGAEAVSLRITGEGGAALPMALVKIFTSASLNPAVAVAGPDGVAAFRLPAALLRTVVALVVEPVAGHWSKAILKPRLDAAASYTIKLDSFSDFDAGFRQCGAPSWGVGALGLQGKAALTGAGCKVGVIDSGCSSDHSLLRHVTRGMDLNPEGDADSWRIDEIGHGTHVCGIVGASGAGAVPMRGMAPEAELHMYKIFPSGDTFTLASAIEAALTQGMDIINMSLTCAESLDVAEQLARARAAGIACFAAAGNEGRAVMFPARLEVVMAVSALGRIGTAPADSLSALTMLPGSAEKGGYFLPNFTCFGDAVDFAGPGVGVISTVPGDGLKALDGTSMASPHIAGLAALYLAHDPQLRNMGRSPARLETLHELLRQRSNAMAFRPDRVGNGLPSVGPLGALHEATFSAFLRERMQWGADASGTIVDFGRDFAAPAGAAMRH